MWMTSTTSHTAISIHAPRTGSDPVVHLQFLPFYRHFNPRSPHGERRDVLATYWETLKISIHAPRTGSDVDGQSVDQYTIHISIHAPRTGSDN